MRIINLGIIGLGYVGKIHLHNSLKLPNAKVLGVADVSKKSLNEAKKSGIKKTYDSYSSLLKNPEIEAVVIGLPTHLHLQCAREAAEAGKDIFLEKPMARTVVEAREILSVAQRNSVKLMMGYPLRFNERFRNLKEKIAYGLLGDVENAHATMISSGPFFHRAEDYAPVPVPDWWFNREFTGGGALIDLGSHVINLLRWYFGEITDIKAHFGHRFNMDFEDSAMCLTKFNSGTVALVNVGWFSPSYALKIDLFGSSGNLSAQHSPQKSAFAGVQMLATGSSKFHKPHLDELQYFLKCIITDSQPSPSGQDGLNDIQAITLAYNNQISLK